MGLEGYLYHKIIPITGASTCGTGYQVPIIIHSGAGDDAPGVAYLDGLASLFPYDLAVTADDGITELDFFIEDLHADPLVMWVEVTDSLNAGETATIYLYFGNPSQTTSKSNCADTFPTLGSDFGGVALDTGMWAAYAGEFDIGACAALDGRQFLISRPIAVRYVGAHDRTYFVYEREWSHNDSTKGGAYIAYYDHDTKQMSDEVFLWYTQPNIHCTPSIHVIQTNDDGDAGKILVFGAKQDASPWSMGFRKSTNAEDISAWGAYTELSSKNGAWYPQPVELSNGDIAVFYKAQWASSPVVKREVTYIKTTDSGATWGSETRVTTSPDTWVDEGDHRNWYPCVVQNGATTHIFCSFMNVDAGVQQDIRYLCNTNNLADGAWKRADGTVISNPPNIDASMCDYVHDTNGNPAYVSDCVATGVNPGEAYVVYSYDTGGSGDKVGFASYYSAAWNVVTVCDGFCVDDIPNGLGFTIYDGVGTFDPANPEDLYVSKDITSHAEIWKYVWNPSTHAFDAGTVLVDNPSYHAIRPLFVRNASADLEFFWVHLNRSVSQLDWDSEIVAYPSTPNRYTIAKGVGARDVHARIYSATNLSDPMAIRFCVKPLSIRQYGINWMVKDAIADNDEVAGWIQGTNAGLTITYQTVRAGTAEANANKADLALNTWAVWEYRWAAQDNTKFYKDGALKYSHTAHVTAVDCFAWITESPASLNSRGAYALEWFVARKYRTEEPIVGTPVFTVPTAQTDAASLMLVGR
jgi:hypothetical protein